MGEFRGENGWGEEKNGVRFRNPILNLEEGLHAEVFKNLKSFLSRLQEKPA